MKDVINFNSVFRGVANEQNVEPGSPKMKRVFILTMLVLLLKDLSLAEEKAYQRLVKRASKELTEEK